MYVRLSVCIWKFVNRAEKKGNKIKRTRQSQRYAEINVTPKFFKPSGRHGHYFEKEKNLLDLV